MAYLLNTTMSPGDRDSFTSLPTASTCDKGRIGKLGGEFAAVRRDCYCKAVRTEYFETATVGALCSAVSAVALSKKSSCCCCCCCQ
jgi:hypothetical protein